MTACSVILSHGVCISIKQCWKERNATSDGTCDRIEVRSITTGCTHRKLEGYNWHYYSPIGRHGFHKRRHVALASTKAGDSMLSED